MKSVLKLTHLSPKFKTLALALSGVILSGFPAVAATWVGNSGADWITPANWTPGVPVSGDSLVFGAAGSSGTSLTNTLTTSAFNIGTITFNAGAPAYTLTGNTFNQPNTTLFTNSSSNVQLLSFTGGITSNAATPTFNLTGAGANLSTGLVFTRTTAQTLTVNTNALTLGSLDMAGTGAGATARTTVIAGTGNITIGGVVQATTAPASGISLTGSGTVTLGGANTYTGNTAATSGSLVLSNTLALQNSTLVKNTGSTTTVVFDSSVASHNFTFGGLASNNNSQTIALVDNAGSPNAVALTVGNNNATTTYAGTLTGAGSVTKVGTGSLTLSGGNSFSGGLTIQAGTVVSTTFTQALGGNTGLVTLGNAATNSGVTLQPQMAGQTFSNPIAVGDAGNTNVYSSTLQFGAGTGGIYAGAIKLNSRDLTINTGTNTTASSYTGQQLNATSVPVKGINGTGNLTLNTAGASAFTFTNATGNTINNTGSVEHTGTGAGDLTIAAVIGSSVTGVTQNSSSSKLILSGTNTYTGPTAVNAGTLLVNGSLASASAVTVGAGGILGGSGTIGGDVAVTGSLAPGNSPGLLTINRDLTLSGSSDVAMEIAGTTRGSLYDAVNVGGQFSLDGDIDVTSLSHTFANGNSFDLFNWGTLIDNGYSLNLPTLTGGLSWDTSTFASNGIISVVPEPQTYAMLSVGLTALATFRRRERKVDFSR